MQQNLLFRINIALAAWHVSKDDCFRLVLRQGMSAAEVMLELYITALSHRFWDAIQSRNDDRVGRAHADVRRAILLRSAEQAVHVQAVGGIRA